MIKSFARYKNTGLRRFIRKHEKYAPLLFFMGGFAFDWMTLGRIDRLYDLFVLCSHMTLLSVTLYLFNRADDGVWKGTFLDRFEEYFPLAIQFFFGALSSAYIVYFSRSVSLSKTSFFFFILILLLVANEFLKQRISNKYLQFGVYSFLSFTFFSFIIPVFISQMDMRVFVFSGAASLMCTLALVTFIYFSSPSTRSEVRIIKLYALIALVYAIFYSFYFFRLIPPVPLALDCGLVAHHVEADNGKYRVTFETNDWYIFWRQHRLKYARQPDEPVYVYSAIFAPTNIEKTVMHRWNYFDPNLDEWVKVEDIGFDIQGGRTGGFRGYTFKNNVVDGEWKVEVMTEEELVIGVIDFEVVTGSDLAPHRLIKRIY